MEQYVRYPTFCLFALAASLLTMGCGESTDFDAAYDLEATNSSRGPGKTVADLLTQLDQQLRGREVDAKAIVAETVENIEGFEASAFGDKAADFEKIKTGLADLKKQADANASRAQLQELSSTLKEQGEQLAGDPAPPS